MARHSPHHGNDQMKFFRQTIHKRLRFDRDQARVTDNLGANRIDPCIKNGFFGKCFTASQDINHALATVLGQDK